MDYYTVQAVQAPGPPDPLGPGLCRLVFKEQDTTPTDRILRSGYCWSAACAARCAITKIEPVTSAVLCSSLWACGK